MIWWVAAMLVVSGVASCSVPRMAYGRRPRDESLALAVLIVVLAGATFIAASTSVLLGVARLATFAGLGSWHVRSADPAPIGLSVVATVGIAAWAVIGIRAAWREFGALRSVHRLLGSEPFDGVDTLRLGDERPSAHAVARWGWFGGRIVLTAGLDDVLDDEERAAVVAHERAHLRGHHFTLRLVGRLGCVVNPLLRPLAVRLDDTLERWADHEAAAMTDRATVASAIARVALGEQTASFGPLGAGGSRHLVVERVEHLLDPPDSRRGVVGWASALALGAVALSVALGQITETYFEHLMH